MDRRNFFFKQRVSKNELNAAFDGVEQAIWDVLADLGLTGVIANMAVTQHSPSPNMTVDVSGSGVAYDPAGERVAFAATQNVNLAVDSLGAPTTVATGGNTKIVSVFAQFARTLSDPRTDGNNVTVEFVAAESFAFSVVQSAEALSPTAPPLDPTKILLADMTITHTTTTILTGAISTARRQDAIVVSGSPVSIRRGRILDGLADVLGAFNAHVTGGANKHPAGDVNYAGGPAWADVTTNPAASVEAQLDKIVSDLAGTGGTAKIGGLASTGTRFGLSNATLRSQLVAIKGAIDTLMTTGPDTLTTYASIAALRAVVSSAVVTNGVAAVAGFGLFIWSPASTATDDALFVVRPTDNPATGRWLSLSAQIGGAFGLAQLDTDARIAALTVRGAINNKGTGTHASFTTASTSPVDVSGMLLSFTGTETGDVFLILLNGEVIGGSGLFLQVVAQDNGGGFGLVQHMVLGDSSSAGNAGTSGMWVAADNGTTQVKVQGYVSSPSGSPAFTGDITVLRYRP